MTDILADLRDTLAGDHTHPWTGEDGLFARAAAEIETLRRDYAILLERWKEAEARKPLLNAELAHRDRQIRELSDALTWTAQRLRDVLARRPVRDATECLANADRLTGSNRLSCMNQEDSAR